MSLHMWYVFWIIFNLIIFVYVCNLMLYHLRVFLDWTMKKHLYHECNFILGIYRSPEVTVVQWNYIWKGNLIHASMKTVILILFTYFLKNNMGIQIMTFEIYRCHWAIHSLYVNNLKHDIVEQIAFLLNTKIKWKVSRHILHFYVLDKWC